MNAAHCSREQHVYGAGRIAYMIRWYNYLEIYLGIIEIDFSGKLAFGVSMSGMIRKPGGYKYLAIGNINFKMGITLVALPTIGKLYILSSWNCS